MFRSLLSSTLLCASALVAEQLDNIEFTLPEIASEWEANRTVNNDYGSAILFFPKDTPETAFHSHAFDSFYSDDDDDSSYYFHAMFYKTPYDPETDAAQVEAQLSLLLPSLDYQFYLVDQADDFSTFEFYAFDDFGFSLYGVMRKMRSENGTVTLTYCTDDEELVPLARRAGLAALKHCHALTP